MYGALHVYCDMNFSVLEKLPSCCLNETSQLSEYCLKTFLNHKIVDCQSKLMALVMVYFGILCDRMLLMFTIPSRNCQSRIQSLFYINLNDKQ